MVKKQKKILILAIAATIATLILVAAVQIAANRTDDNGVQNFQGEERRAAQLTVDELHDFYSQGPESVGNIVVQVRRVVDVSKTDTPTSGMYSTCKATYEVSYVEVDIFGQQGAVQSRTACLH